MPPDQSGIDFDIEIATPDLVPMLLLLSLLASFGLIRMSTRLMRSPKVPWWPGSITTGDLHIHHLVFGIVLLLVSGFLAFAFLLESPWIELAAIAFGIGAGLTLDEYALWLHLDDVYWSEEGRSSVDAMVIAVVFAGLVITVDPFASTEGAAALIAVAVAIKLIICGLAVLKGKYVLGLAGFFIPFMAEVGAIRLARPQSIWARKRYDPDGAKMQKAIEREETLNQRRNWLRDVVGGAPNRVADAVKTGSRRAE
ncbi:MAG: hypothetical protein ACR2N5_00480 [Solirubrobacterales bacterium]